jgi:hypothetical protein
LLKEQRAFQWRDLSKEYFSSIGAASAVAKAKALEWQSHEVGPLAMVGLLLLVPVLREKVLKKGS